jgi:hypothetical protein
MRRKKKTRPTSGEIGKALDAAVIGTPVFDASSRLATGKAQAGDVETVYAFFADPGWCGAMAKLDRRWPRQVWYPILINAMKRAERTLRRSET